MKRITYLLTLIFSLSSIAPSYPARSDQPFYKKPEIMVPAALVIGLVAYVNKDTIKRLLFNSCKKDSITIVPLTQGDVPEVKHLIAKVINDVFDTEMTDQQVLELLENEGELADLNSVATTYGLPHGKFLVVKDGEKIVGCGGIKKLSNDIAELKRFWFLSEARGRGLSRTIADDLISFAKQQRYKKIRLEVHSRDEQQRAICFYKKLGFYEIDHYRKRNEEEVAMELDLNSK